MRKPRIIKALAVLAAVALTLWLVSPSQAESGCHKVKDRSGSVKAVPTQTVS